ncbi:hypothetical protein [Accumulibacter sp.]|uniref:hypothetical protein n=1 Tax=Accumulibacter sp. TaxID=2053492 RepID=UPI0028C47F07|nr:hypothetical protein [Accumulibacter sp.]
MGQQKKTSTKIFCVQAEKLVLRKSLRGGVAGGVMASLQAVSGGADAAPFTAPLFGETCLSGQVATAAERPFERAPVALLLRPNPRSIAKLRSACRRLTTAFGAEAETSEPGAAD